MNKKKWITLGIIAAIVLVVIIVFVSQYNGFVNAEEDINQAKSNIQVELQTRADKIGQLIEPLKDYMSYESETYLAIVEARTAVSNATDVPSTQNAIEQIKEATNLIQVTVEAYPELKSEKLVQDFMAEITEAENRINYARNQYNEKATGFNKKIRRFPGNLFASLYGFDEPVELFTATESAQSVPNTSLN